MAEVGTGPPMAPPLRRGTGAACCAPTGLVAACLDSRFRGNDGFAKVSLRGTDGGWRGLDCGLRRNDGWALVTDGANDGWVLFSCQ